jgi:hypothetical protein
MPGAVHDQPEILTLATTFLDEGMSTGTCGGGPCRTP